MHSSFIDQSLKLKVTQMTIRRLMVAQLWYSPTDYDLAREMNEPLVYAITWMNLQIFRPSGIDRAKKKRIYCDSSFTKY